MLPFLYKMKITTNLKHFHEPASETVPRCPVKIHGNTRNRNLDRPWPAHRNFLLSPLNHCRAVHRVCCRSAEHKIVTT